MKKLFFGLLVMFPIVSIAFPSSTEWMLSENNNMPIVFGKSGSVAAIYIGMVSIVSMESCTQDSMKRNYIWKVNNTKVSWLGACYDGHYIYVPKSDNGRKYVEEQFRKNNSVKIHTFSFSGRKFSEVVRLSKSINNKVL